MLLSGEGRLVDDLLLKTMLFYLYVHRVQKKSNIFIFIIYFSQFLDKFYETFSEYP